jgi:hypothetical protein
MFSIIYLVSGQLQRDMEKQMALIDSLRAEIAQVAADITTLTTDVNAKIAADAAALTAASTNSVTQSDVDSVSALDAQVKALDAVVNPDSSTTQTPAST